MVAGPLTADATWTADSSSTTITLSVDLAGDPIFHDREPAPDTGATDTGFASGAPDYQCPDYLELPVSISFSTDDGAFDETVTGSIMAMDLSSLWATAELDWTALSGSYTFTEIDPTEWDSVSLSISAGWAGGDSSGQVDMSASRTVSGGSGSGTGMGEGMVGPVLRW